jgi:hypothetical protein
MTAILILILTVTAQVGDAGQSNKADAAKLSNQHVATTGPSLKKIVDNVSSIGASIVPSLHATPSDAENATDSANTIVWVRLSKQYIANYVERDVDRTKPVQDLILGTTINGKSRTTGRTRLILQPNEDRAVGRVEFVGETHGRVVGHNGPATLHFNTDSTFRAHKQLTVGESGVVASPAIVNATTRLTPTSIYTSLPGLRGRIGRRIAQRREASSRGQANAIASDHTADDIRHGFDKRLNDAVAEIQSKVRTEIAALKPDDESTPMKLQSRSTADHIELAYSRGEVQDAEWRQIAMSVDGTPDVAVRFQRTLLTRAFGDPEIRERIAPLLGNVAKPQLANTNLKVAKWAIGELWVTLDLAMGDLPAPVARVASGERVQR